MGLLALAMSIVALDLFGMIGRSVFDKDVGRFARTLRVTAEQAIFRGETLAVVIDVRDGYYTVYEANSEDRYDDLEPLIDRKGLDECYIETIEFADGSHQFSGELILHATAEGWESSWLFELIDLDERLRWLRCDGFTPRVVVDNQPLEMLEAHSELSMSSSL